MIKILHAPKNVKKSDMIKSFRDQKMLRLTNLMWSISKYWMYVELSIVDICDIDSGGNRIIECTGTQI